MCYLNISYSAYLHAQSNTCTCSSHSTLVQLNVFQVLPQSNVLKRYGSNQIKSMPRFCTCLLEIYFILPEPESAAAFFRISPYFLSPRETCNLFKKKKRIWYFMQHNFLSITYEQALCPIHCVATRSLSEASCGLRQVKQFVLLAVVICSFTDSRHIVNKTIHRNR